MYIYCSFLNTCISQFTSLSPLLREFGANLHFLFATVGTNSTLAPAFYQRHCVHIYLTQNVQNNLFCSWCIHKLKLKLHLHHVLYPYAFHDPPLCTVAGLKFLCHLLVFQLNCAVSPPSPPPNLFAPLEISWII
jgi:hypothetical protein